MPEEPSTGRSSGSVHGSGTRQRLSAMTGAPEHEDTCSMCGKFCAVRSMNKALSENILIFFKTWSGAYSFMIRTGMGGLLETVKNNRCGSPDTSWDPEQKARQEPGPVPEIRSPLRCKCKGRSARFSEAERVPAPEPGCWFRPLWTGNDLLREDSPD